MVPNGLERSAYDSWAVQRLKAGANIEPQVEQMLHDETTLILNQTLADSHEHMWLETATKLQDFRLGSWKSILVRLLSHVSSVFC